MEINWYAVYTKPRFEKKIAETLSKKGFENYCPLNRVLRQWHDRKKVVLEPLFNSYIFVHTDENRMIDIRRIPGVINFVYWLKKPAVISAGEIDLIRKFLNEYSDVTLEKIPIKINDNIRILRGPLMYKEGNVIGIHNRTVKVLLPSLGYQMVAQVERNNIEILPGNLSQFNSAVL